MTGFSITVDGIERREYYQACRVSGRRIYAVLAAIMGVVCAAILLLSGDLRPADFAGPVVVFVLVVLVYEIGTRAGYKDQLAVVDPPVAYGFSDTGWSVNDGERVIEFLWKQTPRLERTRDCLFLYNDESSSSLLPLRLLSAEQTAAIEGWYAASRAEAKQYKKELEKQYRSGRLGRLRALRSEMSGPAWGPWKKNRK